MNHQAIGSEPVSENRKRQRSPSYPSNGLETCVNWAKKIYDSEKRSTTSALVAVKHMGYSSLSGPARTGLSAIKKFGLLLEEGGDRVRISEEAVKLFLSPDDGQRLSFLRSLALRPEIIKEIVYEHSDGLPSDDSLRYKLVTDRGFGEEAANTVIKALRETVRFAKLDPGEFAAPPPSTEQQETVTDDGATPLQKPKYEDRRNDEPAAGNDKTTAGALHVWSLGNGAIVELRSNKPLGPKQFKLLSKYVELAAEAGGEEDSQ